jgi:5'-deoxynucleotidase YfbR-like HD superfamily hydrolase
VTAEAREKIFLAMVEDFGEVIARHLPAFDNNIKEETWKLLEVFTEEVIEQLAV